MIKFQEKFRILQSAHWIFDFQILNLKPLTFESDRIEKLISNRPEIYLMCILTQKTNGEFLIELFNTNRDSYFSIFTDYLLGRANTTLDYNCLKPVSNTLPVTLLDFDGNTVIQLYNMRSGNVWNTIDQLHP